MEQPNDNPPGTVPGRAPDKTASPTTVNSVSTEASVSPTVEPSTCPDLSATAVAAEGWPCIPGYAIEGVLGRGGMGVVYKARRQDGGATVAIKMLRSSGHAAPEERAQLPP